MAADKRSIASTPQGSLRLLGSGGTLALRNHAQIRQYLRASLGEEAAAVLAEPSFDNANGRIDWLSGHGEEPRPLASLEPEAAERVRQRLADFRGKVAALADQLSRRPQQSALLLGELLRQATSVPNEDSVLAVGEEPLLINWGAAAEPGQSARSATQLAAPSRRAAPPPPTPAVPAAAAAATVATPAAAERRGGAWLWTLPLWLLFAALMAAIYYYLMAACAVSGPGAADNDNPLISFCPGTAVADAGPPPELAAERARAGMLKEQLRQLEIRIAEERRACVPGSAPNQTLLPEEELAEEELAEEELPEETLPEEEIVPEEPILPEEEVAEEETLEDPAVDPDEFQRRVEQEGGQQGAVQATLIWDSETDLDLFVACPNGESINYSQPTGCGGGFLDIDANVREIMPNPVEHITWPNGAPPGEYVVLVRSANGSGVDRFQVQIEIAGETRTYSAQVHPGQGPVEIARFAVE